MSKMSRGNNRNSQKYLYIKGVTALLGENGTNISKIFIREHSKLNISRSLSRTWSLGKICHN